MYIYEKNRMKMSENTESDILLVTKADLAIFIDIHLIEENLCI